MGVLCSTLSMKPAKSSSKILLKNKTKHSTDRKYPTQNMANLFFLRVALIISFVFIAPVASTQTPSTGKIPLTSAEAGTSIEVFRKFINQLGSPHGYDDTILIDTSKSSGVSSDGLVSEGQSYGLLLGGTLVSTLKDKPGRESDFKYAVEETLAMFLGWKRLCMLTLLQRDDRFSDSYYKEYISGCDNGKLPCFPHWKFDKAVTKPLELGWATDADEDALLGIILLVRGTASKKHAYPWWDEVARWAFDSVQAFMPLHADFSREESGWLMLKAGSFGGWDCNSPSYHAPAAYKVFRDFSISYPHLSRQPNQVQHRTAQWNMLIRTSYATLLGSQCAENGLVPNWYTAAYPPYEKGTIECQYSGTDGDKFGQEAFRTFWRVALDYIWYPNDTSVDTNFGEYGRFSSEEFLERAVSNLREQYIPGDARSPFATNFDFNNTCLVRSIYPWLYESNFYATLSTALTYPVGNTSAQQSELDSLARRMKLDNASKYYELSWLTISTMTINGDFLAIQDTVTSLGGVLILPPNVVDWKTFIPMFLMPLLPLLWCFRRWLLVRRILAVLCIMTLLNYLCFRTYNLISFEATRWVSVSFFVLELICVTGISQTLLVLWYDVGHVESRRMNNMPLCIREFPTVDVLVPCYGEPMEIIRDTLVAALALDYPAGKVSIYLCDDGKRKELHDMVVSLQRKGAHSLHYVARTKTPGVPHHAKAGNINNCLFNEGCKGEYVVIFDCDMICKPEFLQAVMPHFFKEVNGQWEIDQKLCMVQTPQNFYNIAPQDHLNQHMHGFFKHDMEAWRNMGCAPCCGTGVAFKRAALEEIDGIQYGSITEDFLTSLTLTSRGYKTTYVYENLVEGLAPESLTQFVLQRSRWAGGGLEIFFRSNPLTFKGGLEWKHRIMYFLPGYGTILSVPLLMFLVLISVFVAGDVLFDANWSVMGGDWYSVFTALVTFFSFYITVLVVVNRDLPLHYFPMRLKESGYFAFWFAPLVFKTMFGKKLTFKVTSKEGESERLQDLRFICPHLFISMLYLFVVSVLLYSLVSAPADKLAQKICLLFWSLYFMWQLFPAIHVGLVNPLPGYMNRTGMDAEEKAARQRAISNSLESRYSDRAMDIEPALSPRKKLGSLSFILEEQGGADSIATGISLNVLSKGEPTTGSLPAPEDLNAV
uniref:Glycosyltransferase 2-like domain-containing protein n=2 Tax=Mucochytrium quahogii TaxID=96639 RepID=A0A7S2S9H6_9STRA|mmetsp:Transcript_2699/g.5714  ORF Transcript_2699/g.5714 Transcript_2699/m.5714 type:complete len:1162 (+) Transcript_2699:1566-5051(+)